MLCDRRPAEVGKLHIERHERSMSWIGARRKVLLLTSVIHHVHTALGEDSHLSWVESLLYHRRAVLLDHVGVCLAVDRDDIVAGPGMEMGWQHRARTEVEHRHYAYVSV